MSDVPIQWSKDRHDKAVTVLREEDARKRVLPVLVKTYEAWKRRFKKKARTQPEIIQELYRLHNMIGDAVKHTPGMADWREFTLNLIEDNITKALQTECGKRNVFNERTVPTSDNSISVPEFHPFDTADDLKGIPFLKQHVEREGFVGFIRDGRIIHALYDHGEIVLCGHVLTLVGIDKLPTLTQVRKELKEKPPFKEGSD